ncbi:MAG: hypothetical protein E6342_15790 [Clostridium sp.]|nr:hypothetical protein [Clostridium sp.]MBS5936798.1 hypothetical protein [Clostridium sp.]MDU1278351.1 hypothetical protein [Clostridium sp.]MDU7089167.1 hypothetical protein [Clostridium sp.]MDU7948764.1 hypothetical protein [Clostridium sp.]
MIKDTKVQIRLSKEEREQIMKYCLSKGVTLSSEFREFMYRLIIEDTVNLLENRKNNIRKELN